MTIAPSSRRAFFAACGLVALLAVWIAGGLASSLRAEDKGKVLGAIWKYEMSPLGSSETRVGKFRIHGDDVYQPQGKGKNKSPTKIGVILGKPDLAATGKPQQGDVVQVEFEALRDSEGRSLKCRGPISFQVKGEVTGRLVDADGVEWEFKAARVQE